MNYTEEQRMQDFLVRLAKLEQHMTKEHSAAYSICVTPPGTQEYYDIVQMLHGEMHWSEETNVQ